MAKFKLRTINHLFSTEAELEDRTHAEAALSEGVHGALMIAVEELTKGQVAVAIEVIVEDEEGHMLCRSAVAASVVPLAVAPL